MSEPEHQIETLPLAGTVVSSGEAVSTPAPAPQTSVAAAQPASPEEE